MKIFLSSLIISRFQFQQLFFAFLFAAANTFVFAQTEIAKVLNEEENTLNFAWAGGMNSMQFGEIDLNRDGIKDLVAFDRTGNRKMCFINNGLPGQIDYEFAPSYKNLIPELFEWTIFADYNGDGKEDIFTYSPGWAGMKVYKNTSDEVLKFELVVYPYLKTYQGGGFVNLLVTSVDYPGIADIDGDGDLDIFSFWGLGSFLNYHKNLSYEKYGNADSLDFELEEYCWGRFAESDASNEIFLDTCFIESGNANNNNEKERHTGSTLLFLDLDADYDKDLLIADIDFPGLWALTNGGDIELALITNIDTLFPQNSQQARVFSMPAAAYIDINNDGKKDLIFSPFDAGSETSENKYSVWLYLNSGENNQPVFEFISANFLQSKMIDHGSGAYPALFDWDGDGLLDLFIGNFGVYQYSFYNQNNILHSVYQSSISFYKNTGTETNPGFKLMNNDFGNLTSKDQIGFYPAFSDLTGDNLPEMICGNSDGKLILLENKGNNILEITDENYFSIDVGEFSAPQLFDLDKDGLKDLIIGEKNGNINYYKNQGTRKNPDFLFITDSLGKINVTDFNLSYSGYSTPCFFSDASGTTGLVVGSEQGQLFYFTNIDENLDGQFTLSDDLANLLDTTNVSFDLGARTSAALADLNKDGNLEMLAGNFSGGLEYFNGNAEVSPGFKEIFSTVHEKLIISPNPATEKISIASLQEEGDYQFEIYQETGKRLSSGAIDYTYGTKITVDISSLGSGFYVLRFFNTKQSITCKFIVK